MAIPFPIPIPTPTITEISSYIGRPKLVAFIPEDEPTKQIVMKRAFYHIGLTNLGKTPVKNARVYFNFEGLNIKFTTIAKWDWTAEPFDTYTNIRPNVVPWLVVDSQVHDILPAISETVAVLMKYENEDEAYPFSAFSYLYPDLKLPNKIMLGECVVKAILYSENYKCSLSFKVNNKGRTFNDVSIDPITDFQGIGVFKPIKWKY